MSADIVNLRQARKRKARDEEKRKANERSIEFGRSRKQKAIDRAETVSILTRLESHRRDPKL